MQSGVAVFLSLDWLVVIYNAEIPRAVPEDGRLVTRGIKRQPDQVAGLIGPSVHENKSGGKARECRSVYGYVVQMCLIPGAVRPQPRAF